MVFVDGAGQHNAGASIGTDGNIAECMMTGFADYVFGDATSAYGTYSPLNSPNHPVAGVDWSWGYIGANPVERAHRRVLAVDDGTLPPYFVVVDDIRKDDGTHAWQWRMHTQDTYTVDTSGNPLRVLAPTATLDIHVLRPEAFTVATTPFDNLNLEANSTLLSLDYAGVEPDYTVILVPSPGGETPPTVARTSAPWGAAATIDFGEGDVDVLIRNDDGETVSHAGVTTDARIALVRLSGSTPLHYLAVDMTTLSVGGDLYAEMRDAPASCAQSGQTLHVGRYDADFRFRDTGATEVLYEEQALGFVDDGGGFLVSDQVTAASDAPSPAARLSLEAWPNPFNPDVSIRIEASGGGVVALAVYDVAGRRVRDLWRGPVDGARTVAWDGRNDAGHRVASGTYFAVATTPTARYVARVTLVK
jgi:hypothetical protein